MGIRLGSFTSTTTGDEVLTLGLTDNCCVVNASVNTKLSVKTGKDTHSVWIGGFLVYLNGKFNAIADPEEEGKNITLKINGKKEKLFMPDGSVNPLVPVDSDKVAELKNIDKYEIPE